MITQREALKALLDGKTIETQDHLYKMDGDNIMFRYGDISPWKQLSWLRDDAKIFEESYPLTFSEAYLKMKMGKKAVRKGDSKMYYYIANLPQGMRICRRVFFKPIDDSEPGMMASFNMQALEDEWRVLNE